MAEVALQKLNRKELLELLLLQQKKIEELTENLEAANATLEYQKRFMDGFQVLIDMEERLGKIADRMEAPLSPVEELHHGL